MPQGRFNDSVMLSRDLSISRGGTNREGRVIIMPTACAIPIFNVINTLYVVAGNSSFRCRSLVAITVCVRR